MELAEARRRPSRRLVPTPCGVWLPPSWSPMRAIPGRLHSGPVRLA